MSSTSLRAATADRLSARIAEEQAQRRLPSVMAGLVRDGHLVWAAGRGRVQDGEPTTDTQYRMGSITKPLVAVAVLRLRDAGRLRLEDRVEDHVPATPVGGATISQLLAHASGLQAETEGPWWERSAGGPWDELARSLPPHAARHRPGRRFHYSNVGYAVLGELLVRAHGAPWDEVVRDEVLRPLEMDRTTTRPQAPAARGYAVHPWADVLLPEPEHDAGAMAPAGQLWSTIDDVARFATLLAGDGGDVLHDDTIAEMCEPVAVTDQPGEPWTAAYGLGVQIWNVDGHRTVGHGGSMPGFLMLLRVDRESGDGAVVATNSTAGLQGQITTDLLALLAREEPRPPRPWAPLEVTSEVLGLTGLWYWGPIPLQLRAERELAFEIAPVAGPGRASRFRAEPDGTFTGLDGYYAGETLRVVRNTDGSVSHLDLASFILTRTPYDPDADVPGGVDPGGWRAAPHRSNEEHP